MKNPFPGGLGSLPGANWEHLGAPGWDFHGFSWFWGTPGDPESTGKSKKSVSECKFFHEFSNKHDRSHDSRKMREFLQNLTKKGWKIYDFPEISSTNLPAANAAGLQDFRFNFNNLFPIYCRSRVARVVAGSRCESIESSMTSCQNRVARFSWISNFCTKLRERGLHKRLTIRWKKSVEFHFKTKK